MSKFPLEIDKCLEIELRQTTNVTLMLYDYIRNLLKYECCLTDFLLLLILGN